MYCKEIGVDKLQFFGVFQSIVFLTQMRLSAHDQKLRLFCAAVDYFYPGFGLTENLGRHTRVLKVSHSYGNPGHNYDLGGCHGVNSKMSVALGLKSTELLFQSRNDRSFHDFHSRRILLRQSPFDLSLT